MTEKKPNPWRLSNGHWDWPKIKQAYLGGRWPDFERCSAEVGISPSSQVRKVAAEQDWNGQRAALQQKAEHQAVNRILGRLTQEFEKRLIGMLQTADVLRAKGFTTLKSKKTRLSNMEAIRAVSAATDIEREIFLRNGKPIGGLSGPGDDEGGSGSMGGAPLPPEPGNPGLLPMPSSISEINDAHLIRIIEHKPKAQEKAEAKPAPKDPAKAKGAAKHLGGGVVEGKDRNNPGGGSSGGPAPKGRKN